MKNTEAVMPYTVRPMSRDDIAQVTAIQHTNEGSPLVYHNRLYHKLGG